MAIRFSTQGIKYTLKNKRKITGWIKEIAKRHHKIVGEITIIFTSDGYILEINNQYLNHNYFTDIITFDYSSKNLIEGDIFISIETVRSNSLKFKTSFSDETLRVIIHGVLHLVGFRDKSIEDKKEMTINEDLALETYYKINE